MSGVIEVFWRFLILGCTSFGGPVAHIGYFHNAFVGRLKWLTEQQFAQLLAISQFLPGPASSQLGFAIGLQRAGWLGGLVAFIAFTLPSVLLLLLFLTGLPYIPVDVSEMLIHGLKLVACIVVTDAVISMFNKLCKQWITRVAALLALLMVFIGFPGAQLWAILLGGILGWRWSTQTPVAATQSLAFNYSRTISIICCGLFLLLLSAAFLLPENNNLVSIGGIFYQAGALVFGGGHVVLPLLENALVDTGWISAESFLAGYGASQAIPGPLFSFAAYLGAIFPYQGSFICAALVALCGIFLPGFLLMVAVLPYWQQILHMPSAAAAVAGVNAAVVGILAAALYQPILTAGILSVADGLIAVIGFLLLTLWKRSVLWVVLWCVLATMGMGMYS